MVSVKELTEMKDGLERPKKSIIIDVPRSGCFKTKKKGKKIITRGIIKVLILAILSLSQYLLHLEYFLK